VKLPRFLRQWAAKFMVLRSEERGGLLQDYANGKWREIMVWDDEQGSNEAAEIAGNMMDRGSDAIYVCLINCEGYGGNFLVFDSNRKYHCRYFYPGIYELVEAFVDTVHYCREVANKMGFRNPEESNV
jgi:hypothetical protein